MKFSSTVTTKGQVTIPKAVREYMGIDSGSNLAFTIEPENKRVYIAVENELITCFLCNGSGQVDSQKPCFFCLEKGKLSPQIRLASLIPIWQRKYDVVVSFQMNNVVIHGRTVFVPEVFIHHDFYPLHLLLEAKDFILVLLFRDFVAREKMYLNEEELSLLTSRLVKEDMKKNALNLFQLED